MNNYFVGHQAERVASKHLVKLGYKIIDINWKTRVCEIDIIAEKEETMYFFEVKYRSNALQGLGFDYITAKKLQQMAYSAEMWVVHNNWQGDYQLGAIEISGPDYSVIEVLTDL